MKLLENEKVHSTWLKANALMVFSMFVYLSLYPFAPNYFGRLYQVAYILLPLLAVPCFLLFSRLRGSWELKLFLCYCLWISLISISGGRLVEEINVVILLGNWMCLSYIGTAFLLPAERRMKLLDAAAAVVCAAYSILGIVCIYAAQKGVTIYHPLTGVSMCERVSGRLYVFNTNCNSVSIWYYIVFSLLVYLFVRSSKIWQRVPIACGMVISYVCLALTFGRSGMVAFSVSVGMIAVALGLKYLPLKNNWHKLAAIVLLICIAAPAAYKSFEVTTEAAEKISFSLKETSASEATLGLTDESPAVQSEAAVITRTESLNNRGMGSSGRGKLWLSSLECLREEPLRLLTGSSEAVKTTNEYIEQNYPEEYKRYGYRPNHHNTYLEIFLEYGLPGVVLIMSVFVLLVLKMIKLFFAQNTALSVKILIIMLTGIMIYNCFESTLFYIYDFRTVIFCIAAGYVLAFEKELFPRT